MPEAVLLGVLVGVMVKVSVLVPVAVCVGVIVNVGCVVFVRVGDTVTVLVISKSINPARA